MLGCNYRIYCLHPSVDVSLKYCRIFLSFLHIRFYSRIAMITTNRKDDSRYDYDLFVVGGGSGGVRSSRIAGQHGARVALAEEKKLGKYSIVSFFFCFSLSH